MYYHNDEGDLCSIPAGFTDISSPDPFVVVSGGRSYFRVTELLELSRLLWGISSDSGIQDGDGGEDV